MGYRIQDFAALTGVTVRALQHYDRLGLLNPVRTAAGHRVYASADEPRVRRILALREVGLSLQQIRQALDAPESELSELLAAQRRRLEQARGTIDGTIRVLGRLEQRVSETGQSPLDLLARELDMQHAAEQMRGYFSDDAWTRWGARYFEDWPGREWGALFREIEASLDEDPAGDRAQALLVQSGRLWNAGIGSDRQLSTDVREGYGKAWSARESWPAELKRRYADFKIERIARFLGDAAMASARLRGLVQTYTFTTPTRSIA